MDIDELINRVKALIDSAKKLPLGKMVIDEGQLREAIEQVGLTLPREIKAAQQLLKGRDDIINQAQREAKRLTAAAEEEFRIKLQESNLTKAAERKAREIVSVAERRAEILLGNVDRRVATTKEDADQYTLEVLRNLDGQLSGLLNQVHKGIAMLEKQT